MPIYVYLREDGTTFEKVQNIQEPALVQCPTTGQVVTRVIAPPLLQFNGSGWYVNDYGKNKNNKVD